jgi:TetR/AcrR family tetracycline transcriptional repressor
MSLSRNRLQLEGQGSVERVIPLRRARVIVLTVERFTVGYVLEEQAPRPDADALRGFDMTGFAEQHPTMVAAITEYFEPGRTVDDLFAECLGLVIEGAAARSAAAS